jgi:translocation and assembly module TamA
MQTRLVRAAAALLAFLSPAFLVPPAAAQPAGAPAAQAPSGHIEYRVRIEAPREIEQLLSERMPLMRWRDDPQMTPALLERLVAEAQGEVRVAVATRGYFSAQVTTEIERDERPWTVVIRVDPGEPVRVSHAEIAFSGAATADPQAPPLLQRIRREWRLPPGARFTQDDWDGAKTAASRALADWRYAAARVARSRARIDPGIGRATLEVELDSGPAFRYGAVEVNGMQRYPEEMVAGLSPVAAGELYEREELRLYERRLLATGYFVSAQVDMVSDPERAEAAPVRVSVIEGRSQQIETGLSFNTDVGVRIEGRYTNMNVFDTAWRTRSELRLDQLNKQARLDLDTPPRPGGRWRNHFVQWREATVQNETTAELAAGVSQNWGLGGEPSAVEISAHLEEQRILGQAIDNRHAIFVGYRTQLRDTDSWESPRRGTLVELAVGGSPEQLASRAFARGTVRALLFIPVKRHDLLLRGEAGLVYANAREGIPSAFLFRTGGDQTVRGYAFESLGVRRDAVVLGGRYLLIGSVEYTHWVGDNWGLAAFVDAGDAWDGGRFEPAFGPGVGARFRTPIGPVRADLAYGTRTDQIRLHFSVGFTF